MKENYIFLAKYNRWINNNIYDSASKLSDIDRKLDRKSFFGSIHNSLNHIMLADKIWLTRFSKQGKTFQSLTPEILEIKEFSNSLSQVLFNDFNDLKAHRYIMDESITNWIEEISDEFINQTMIYENMKGIKREHYIWQALSHFFNHQTHHRGQITTMLCQAGIDAGVTDLIALV